MKFLVLAFGARIFRRVIACALFQLARQQGRAHNLQFDNLVLGLSSAVAAVDDR